MISIAVCSWFVLAEFYSPRFNVLPFILDMIYAIMHNRKLWLYYIFLRIFRVIKHMKWILQLIPN
jgi:hypothetical protein